ncbi:LAFE_0E02674g1_1 [Lachancea fermentati]|uniref:LAFE_0E02674g1_1 n=1 Tax=Lachancea fermentati TaxID=4955 RepID=A0A1G4MCG0_LACFM|nr:LAFE_0E02674g1_1 [Lachancea fermentati]
MKAAMKAAIVLSLTPVVLSVASYNHQGCYKASDLESLLSSKGEYEYQSVSYCEEQCDGSAIAALVSGSTCYCGDSTSVLSGLTAADSSDCDKACNGWPYQNCGGSGYMDVYMVAGASVSSGSAATSSTASGSSASSSSSSTASSSTASSASSSDASTSSSTSSASSSTSSSSSTTSSSSASSTSSSSTSSSSTSSSSTSQSSSSSSTTSSSSSSSTTSSTTASATSSQVHTTVLVTSSLSVVTLSNNGLSTVFVTATTLVTPSATSNAGTSGKNSSGKSALSGGAIAGIVVGVVVGSIAIAALIFFLLWRRRKDQHPDLEETKQHQPYSFGHNDVAPLPGAHLNNSLHSGATDVDPILHDDLLRPSPVFEDNYGRIRLSNGSLPDVTQEHKPLRIVNPDSEDLTDEERY